MDLPGATSKKWLLGKRKRRNSGEKMVTKLLTVKAGAHDKSKIPESVTEHKYISEKTRISQLKQL